MKRSEEVPPAGRLRETCVCSLGERVESGDRIEIERADDDAQPGESAAEVPNRAQTFGHRHPDIEDHSVGALQDDKEKNRFTTLRLGDDRHIVPLHQVAHEKAPFSSAVDQDDPERRRRDSLFGKAHLDTSVWLDC